MINLEQVKLLESKVAKAIDYIERLTAENASLQQKETELQSRLGSYQKRIDELEILIMRFKEDHGQIESGILAALEKLNQFEEAMDKSIKPGKEKPAAKEAPHPHAPKAPKQPAQQAGSPKNDSDDGDDSEKICFEIPENSFSLMESSFGLISENGNIDIDDVADPLTDTLDKEPPAEEELEIF